MSVIHAIRGRRAAADGTGRAIRLAAGLPLRFVGDELGVSARTLCNWEHGTRTPSAEHAAAYYELLERLRRELEVSA